MTGGGDYIRSVRRATLPPEIVNSIADLIIRGIWKPGDMIPTEKELATRFGVGRSTIREAVKSLVVLGVLEARAGDGSFICEPTSKLLSGAFRWGLLLSERNLSDLVETMALVEGECAKRAAQAPSARAVYELFALHEEMVSCKDDHLRFMECDKLFHVHIANMAQNAIYTNIAATIQEIVQVWYPVTNHAKETKVAIVQEHLAIAKAVRAADPLAAHEAMSRHLLSAGGRLKGFLEKRTSATDVEDPRRPLSQW